MPYGRANPVQTALQTNATPQGIASVTPVIATNNPRAQIAPGYGFGAQSGFNPASIDQTQAAQQAWYASLANMPRVGPGTGSPPGFVQSNIGPGLPGAMPPPPMVQRGPTVAPAPQRPYAPPMGLQSRPVAPTLAASSTQRAPVQPGQPGAFMSDETRKTAEQPSLADDFLDAMKPYSYHYKNPGDEPRAAPTGGRYLGVMAQDLEKIPELGHQLILDTPQGKMVDHRTALSAALAGMARLNERVHALESDVTKRGR